MLTDDDMNKLAQGFCIQGLSGKSHFDWLGFARAIEALVRAECAPQWRDIETAPKDGTVVLLAGCRKPVAAAWLEDEIDWWHVDDNKRGPFALRGPGPTHWMPLPAAPGIAAPQGEQQ